jgi:hypothetical protein
MTLLLALLLSLQAVNITREGYDNSGTVSNLAENILTPASIASGFGKLFAQPVDGAIYAQPLYVQAAIPGHNVVYVATMNDTVYAFDADTSQPALWTTSLSNSGTAATVSNPNVTGTFGILSTPVIDLGSGSLFAVALTTESGANIYRLHALDLTSGAEKFGGPVVISAPGFEPAIQMQRPALAIANGNVVVSFGSYSDQGPYHGWSMAYAVGQGLAQTGSINYTPTGTEGGVWMSGRGPLVDGSGNMVLDTGNGTYDGSMNFGQSLVKMTVPQLGVADWFTPLNNASETAEDQDLGSSGPLAIPGTSLIVAGGKQDAILLLEESNLGHLTNPIQSLPIATGLYSGMTFGNSTLYASISGQPIAGWYFNGTTFNATPMQSTVAAPSASFGGALAYSPGLLWSSMPSAPNGGAGGVNPGILRVFNTNDLSEIWDSGMNAARDGAGLWSKFRSPVVANGKVYLGSVSNASSGIQAALTVYGLLSSVTTVTSTASFLGQDTSTTGSWEGMYGSDGYSIATLPANVPAYAAMSTSSPTYTWASTTSDPRALQIPASAWRIASTWFLNGGATAININLTDGKTHTVSVYAVDWDNTGRTETVRVVDAASGTQLDSRTITSFANGTYLTWNVSGNVIISATALSGPNPVLSAVFFSTGGTSGVVGAGGSGGASVAIGWSSLSGATAYTIERATNVNGPWTVIGTSTSNSFTDTSAQHGQTYYYNIVPSVTVQ